jgi:uncharacterized membrane protein
MGKKSFIVTAIVNYVVAIFIVGIGFFEGASDDDATR